MFFPLPDDSNHTERTRDRFNESWHRMFMAVINAVKLVLGAATILLVYLWFGPAMEDWFQGPDPLTPQQEKAMLRARSERAANAEQDKIENGIHMATGLKVAEGWELVRTTCTACHSAALVTQNRATYEGWEDMIRWMQATQGLWDLGDTEPKILEYLANNYAPDESGRRANLDVEEIEWYILEL